MPNPLLPNDSFWLSKPILALAALPEPQRNAVLVLVMLLLALPKETLAMLAITVQTHLTDQEIAKLCGVKLYTVKYHWKRFQAIRPRADDYFEGKRRDFYLPDDPAA